MKINFGDSLKYLSGYLTSRTLEKDVQIVTVTSTEGYPEYVHYEILNSEKEFVGKVLDMVL